MTKDNHLLGKLELGGIPAAPRGEPQIEVTFEVDANGILVVSAEEKATGKGVKTTISDEGRLTEDQIEKMIKQAAQFADGYKKLKERVDAKKSFDGYIHSMHDALKDGQSWLDSNPDADAEEIKEKHKQVESICAPIVAKYCGAGGGVAGGSGEEDAQ